MVNSMKLRCKALVVVTVALVVAACSSSAPNTATATDGTYTVTVSVPAKTHHTSDALDLVATLTYQGPQPSIAVDSDDRGFVSFSFEQLGGPRSMSPVSRLMCAAPTTLLRGVPATFRPVKSVAFSEDDPNAAFYRQWAADPQVHLPVGRWQVVAAVRLFDGTTCYGVTPDHTITTPPLAFDVTP